MYVEFHLDGPGGNAYDVMAKTRRALRSVRDSYKAVEDYMKGATSSDSYQSLLNYTANTLDIYNIGHNLREQMQDD